MPVHECRYYHAQCACPEMSCLLAGDFDQEEMERAYDEAIYDETPSMLPPGHNGSLDG